MNGLDQRLVNPNLDIWRQSIKIMGLVLLRGLMAYATGVTIEMVSESNGESNPQLASGVGQLTSGKGESHRRSWKLYQ